MRGSGEEEEKRAHLRDFLSSRRELQWNDLGGTADGLGRSEVEEGLSEENKLRCGGGGKGRRYCTLMTKTMYIYSNVESPDHTAGRACVRRSRTVRCVLVPVRPLLGRMLRSLQLTPGPVRQ